MLSVNFFTFKTSFVINDLIDAGDMNEVIISEPVLDWFTYTCIKLIQNILKAVNLTTPMTSPCKATGLFHIKECFGLIEKVFFYSHCALNIFCD